MDSARQPNYVTAGSEERKLYNFYGLFAFTSTLQGRISYLLMSIHAVNPHILAKVTDLSPHKFLFANMLYGIGMMLFYRPSMVVIRKFNRIVFSILGSMMFNYSTMLVYGWLVDRFSHRPYLVTVLGFLSGRVMMLHLLAYLYHVDSRYRSVHIRQYREYETMYRQN